MKEILRASKRATVLLSLVFMITLIGMGVVSSSISDLEPQSVNKSVVLPQFSDTATYQNISSILLGNGTILFLNAPMTKSGFDFFYTLNSTYTSSLGKYCVNGYGNDVDDPTWQYCFEVTNLGFTSDTGGSIIYSILLILLILFDLFVVYIIVVLDSDNHRGSDGEYIGISIKKYLRIILIGVTYGLILLTLNLMTVVSSATDSSQFYNIMKGLFSLMLRMVWVWTFVIFIWIAVTVWKDNSLIKEIKQRLGEGEWGV